MTEQEKKAIKWMQNVRDDAVVTLDHIAKEEPNVSPMLYAGRKEKAETIINGFEKLEQYRAIGTVEEVLTSVKEEDILKFYYCESEDSYLLGIRIDNFYYAYWDGKRFVFDMSRYLPWGEHVVDDTTAWKEHTYPSEPKEIDFSSWLQGFIKKECGATIEECREAVEKQKAKKPIVIHNSMLIRGEWTKFRCPCCEEKEWSAFYFPPFAFDENCPYCGQKLDWSDGE